MDIHNAEKRYKSARKTVDKANISIKNKTLIHQFVDDLILENLSTQRLIKYLYMMKKISFEFDKDLDLVDLSDMKRFITTLQQRPDFSPWTKKTYKLIVRRFFKWLKKVEGKHAYPPIVSWIPIAIKRSELKLPCSEDMISQEEAEKMINAAKNIRDKAYIAMLWESGARIGELGNLFIKNITFDKYGTLVTMQGKTGSRKIRLVTSTPHLANWLDFHPLKNDKHSALWVNIGANQYKKPMNYANLRKILREVGKEAGLDKRVNPHSFRHARATLMANHLTEFQMNQYFGWIQGSNMPATYVHMSGKEVDSAILRMNGLKEEIKEKIQKPQICVRCDTINSCDSKHCKKCGGYMDLKVAMQAEQEKREFEQQRGMSDNLMAQLLKDQDVQKLLMEKLREMKVSF